MFGFNLNIEGRGIIDSYLEYLESTQKCDYDQNKTLIALSISINVRLQKVR